MAAEVLQFHKTKDYDLPPDAIQLGSLLEAPQYPDEILNKGEIIYISPAPTPVVLTNWRQTNTNVKQGRVGFWARFTHIINVGPEMSVTRDEKYSYDYSFDRLVTTSFYPDKAYLDQSLQQPRIRSYLTGAKYSPIYMVTGVKVVRGANSTVKTNISKAQRGEAKIGVTATIFSLPVNIGPEAQGSTDKSEEVSFGGPSNIENSNEFVIAYRLSKITFRKVGDYWEYRSQKHIDGNGGTMMSGERMREQVEEAVLVHKDEVASNLEQEWERSD